MPQRLLMTTEEDSVSTAIGGSDDIATATTAARLVTAAMEKQMMVAMAPSCQEQDQEGAGAGAGVATTATTAAMGANHLPSSSTSSFPRDPLFAALSKRRHRMPRRRGAPLERNRRHFSQKEATLRFSRRLYRRPTR